MTELLYPFYNIDNLWGEDSFSAIATKYIGPGFNFNNVLLTPENHGFYVIKNVRFSIDIPIYFDMWLLLKDLSDEELDQV